MWKEDSYILCPYFHIDVLTLINASRCQTGRAWHCSTQFGETFKQAVLLDVTLAIAVSVISLSQIFCYTLNIPGDISLRDLSSRKVYL